MSAPPPPPPPPGAAGAGGPPPPPPPPGAAGAGGPPPPPPPPGAAGPPGPPPPPGMHGPPPPPGMHGPPLPPGMHGPPGMAGGLKPKKSQKPKKPMKSLAWNKIKPVIVNNTIWKDIDDSAIKFDIDDFVEAFAQKQAAPKKEEKKQEVKKDEKKCFSQPDRQRNVNIVLNKLHLEPVQISDAIIEYNETLLTDTVCDLLVSIFPTDAEFTTISNQTAEFESEDQYDTCDLFIILVGCVIGYKERLYAIMFKLKYKTDSIEILKLIDFFFKGFEFIKTNKNFKALLEILLAHGNYMNGVTARGGAFGFKLDTFSKFADLKGKGNKVSLLDYIVEYIFDYLKKPEILSIMPFLQLFEKMALNTITEGFNDLSSKFKFVQTLKEKTEAKKNELEEEDKSEEFLKGFYDHANKTVNFIEQKIKAIESKYSEIIKYFGENEKSYPLDKFVQTFRGLYTALLSSLKKYKEKREKLDKKKAK